MADTLQKEGTRAMPPMTTKRSWHPIQRLMSMSWLYIILVLILVVQFCPLIWALLTSLMTYQETVAVPVALVPAHPTFASYIDAYYGDIRHYYSNSSIAATVATIITMALSVFAAYAFARLRFRFKTPLLLSMLSLSLFPPLAQVIPVYSVLQKLHLIGTLAALIIPYSVSGLPLAVLVLIAIFQDIPVELEEAAVVDGLSRFGAFLRVILPATLPGLFTAAVIVFVSDWNEYLFALNYTTPNTYTLPVGIVTISQTNLTVNFAVLSAATLVSVIPLIVRILRMERSIISGFTIGIFKG
jgi:ABC-type glycerol-3-phosphate transport system permease component